MKAQAGTKLSATIEAELALRLKVSAAERGTTMREAVAEAIRMWLATPRRKVKR